MLAAIAVVLLLSKRLGSMLVMRSGHLISIWVVPTLLGIQYWNSKIDFHMEALSISSRNKHWSKYFHQILISSTGYLTICLAIVVQAALESRAACTTTAEHIDYWIEVGQCLFLQSMQSASIFKWIFDFRIWIPNLITLSHTGIFIAIFFSISRALCKLQFTTTMTTRRRMNLSILALAQMLLWMKL